MRASEASEKVEQFSEKEEGEDVQKAKVIKVHYSLLGILLYLKNKG